MFIDFLNGIYYNIRFEEQMRCCQKSLANLIITLQGIILLTSGVHRQRFFEAYSEFTPGEEEDQKLGELVLIVISIIMILTAITSSIFLRLISLCVFSIYVCFARNIAQYHSPSDIASFLCEMLVLGYAVAANIDSFLQQSYRKDKQLQVQQQKVSIERKESQATEKQTHEKQSHKHKHKKGK